MPSTREAVPVKSENRRRLNRSSWAQAVSQIGDEIAQALSYAHGQNVLHRDLKPSNILIDIDGSPRITDLGLALHESVQRQRAGKDPAGRTGYRAPE